VFITAFLKRRLQQKETFGLELIPDVASLGADTGMVICVQTLLKQGEAFSLVMKSKSLATTDDEGFVIYLSNKTKHN
jgi:hypothetical protein